jgi:hypothetical protein
MSQQQPASAEHAWFPAEETDRVRAAAHGLGVLRLARREPGPGKEFVRGVVIGVGSLVALVVISLILTPFRDQSWVQIVRVPLIVLVAGVLIGLIRAVRALVRARMTIYLYDHGAVGTKRSGIRTIPWDRVTQVVVFTSEGVHIVADDNPMIVPDDVVGAGPAREQFLSVLLTPVQHRGIEVLRF